MYDYNLQFADGSRYMILTSPNGYGKTTILNIINSLAKTDFSSCSMAISVYR